MKNLLAFFVLLSLCFGSLQAQFIVVDPGHIVATVANGGIIMEVKKTIEDANTISNHIRNTVADIRQLQQNIDAALWDVKSLMNKDNLDFANIDFETQAVLQINRDLNHFAHQLIPGNHPLIFGHGHQNPLLGSRILQQTLDFSLDEPLSADFKAQRSAQAEKVLSRELFSFAAGRKSIQTALLYNQISDQLLEKAQQLNQILHRSGHEQGYETSLKMNDAERIQLFESTAAYTRKALELRLESDQLIENEMNQQEGVRNHILNAYQNFLICQELFR